MLDTRQDLHQKKYFHCLIKLSNSAKQWRELIDTWISGLAKVTGKAAITFWGQLKKRVTKDDISFVVISRIIILSLWRYSLFWALTSLRRASILLCLLLVSSILEPDRLLFISPLGGISEVFSASIYLRGEASLTPNPQPGGPGCIPFRLGHHF
jgi:hypothetical protein